MSEDNSGSQQEQPSDEELERRAQANTTKITAEQRAKDDARTELLKTETEEQRRVRDQEEQAARLQNPDTAQPARTVAGKPATVEEAEATEEQETPKNQ